MFFLYLALGSFVAGMGVWLAGSWFEKRKSTQPKAKRKKYQDLSEKAAFISRILFVLCALAIVLGVILLQGAQM